MATLTSSEASATSTSASASPSALTSGTGNPSSASTGHCLNQSRSIFGQNKPSVLRACFSQKSPKMLSNQSSCSAASALTRPLGIFLQELSEIEGDDLTTKGRKLRLYFTQSYQNITSASHQLPKTLHLHLGIARSIADLNLIPSVIACARDCSFGPQFSTPSAYKLDQCISNSLTMTTTLPDQTDTTAARSALADVDLAAMVVLVGHLAASTVESASFAASIHGRMPANSLSAQLVASTVESTRLAIEVQNRLPAVMAASLGRSSGPPFTSGVAIPPDALETFIPPNSGEIWYVVIVGREPGLYRTPAEANHQTHGVPGQFSQKKTSRHEALAFYRERYGQPAPDGVQKWVELPELPAPLASGSGTL